jgi:lipase chaperone LimK
MRFTGKRWLGLAAAAGLVALLLAAGVKPRPQGVEASRHAPGSLPFKAGDSAEPAAAASSAAAPSAQSGTPSHQGTDLDGGIAFDDDGHVMADQNLRRLFDYFLADADQAGLAATRARLAAVLAGQGLQAEAMGQVLALFDRYLDYRHALDSLPVSGAGLAMSDPENLRAAFEARYALRRQILGVDVADGFFSRAEAEDRFVMETYALARDQTVPDREREQRLALLEQTLPADIREAREQSRIVVTLQEQTERLRQANADEAEIMRMREELLGPAAASRLSRLDREREQWQQRLEGYRHNRDRILTSNGLSESDKQTALKNLLESEFSEHEVSRVRALDRIERGGG